MVVLTQLMVVTAVAVVVTCSVTIIQSCSHMVSNCHLMVTSKQAGTSVSRSIMMCVRSQSGNWHVYPATEAVGVARQGATHKVTGLVQEEVLSSQVLVVKVVIKGGNMVKLVSGLSLVGVAPEDTQEAEPPQAKVGVMAVGKWDIW